MARVTPETVDHVASLARLSLTAEERQTFAHQLDEVLAYADSLQALAVEDVPPMSHAGAAAEFREDELRPTLDRERVQRDAPDAAEGLFRVPRIL
ncbi:MAG: Asp-tRNA(Asn)/Glu-tRNA(Gln) amidotransferase subunit GatC [Vicinamibacteria bacterium]